MPERRVLLDRDALRFFAGYYRGRLGALALFALLASAQSLLVLPVLALIRRAFDVAIPGSDVRALLWIGAAILLIRAVGSAAALVARALVLRTVKGAVTDLRRDLVSRLYRLSRDFYGRADLAHLHTRLVQDSERVDQMSDALLSGVLPALCASLVLSATLVALDWRLVMLAVAVLPVVWAAGRLSGRLVKTQVRTFQRTFETFSKNVHFALRQMELTRLEAREHAEQVRQHAVLTALRDTGRGMAMSFAVHSQVQRTLTGIAGIAILVGGGVAVARGELSLGGLLAFYAAAAMLNGYVDTLLSGVPTLISGNESLVTLRRLMTEGAEEPYHGTVAVEFDGCVAFEDVSFGYRESDVLREVTLTIPRGANIAITGANGAGKSTLLHLLTGFYRPRSGRLLASGVPYDALDMRVLRRQIGVVPQHPSFFSGTVLENVTYGCPEAGAAAVAAAAHLALADVIVQRLPERYDTPLGEEGMLLSGGECQRLAIARALLGEPRLLVLDEPTTHLDAETVQAVMRRLIDWPLRPALVTISHDPAVIALADAVFHLEDGRLRAVRAASPPTSPEAPADAPLAVLAAG